ncbi:MAG: AAA family ATPase, partial [Propionibacterium sp.]|nr:AAA family ATPase [Propionibacterium sp.]
MTDDADVRSFLASFATLTEMASRYDNGGSGQPRFRDAVSTHLGADATSFTVLSEHVPPHRYVDWDIALAALAALDPDAQLIGLGGGQARYHQGLGDILADRWSNFPVGQVDYVNLPSGLDTSHQAIGLGTRCFTFRDVRVVVYQRRGGPDDDADPMIDVIAQEPAVAVELLTELRRLADEHS